MSKQLLKKNYEKLCRICLKDDKFKIQIFCEYAKKANVQTRIQQYLQINVQLNDTLSKYICYRCFSQLELFEDFYNKAQTAQNTLNESDKYSENVLFEDESLKTPPQNDSITKNYARKQTKRYSTSVLDTDPDNIFKPKIVPKPKIIGSFQDSDDDEGK